MIDGNNLEIQRSLHASPERVWTAWTAPTEIARWWWPERFETNYEIALRPGGSYRYVTAPVANLGVLDLRGRFEEIDPPRLLRYTWHWAGEATVTRVMAHLDPASEGTSLRVEHRGFATPEERDNHVVGWNDCLDRLELYLKKERRA